MTKYLLRRILHGIVSICIVVGIVMIMIYSMLDRNQIFASDPQYSKVSNNDKTVYKYRTWKEYGYIDYITYSDYLQKLVADGVIDQETFSKVSTIGRKADNDKDEVKEYVEGFAEYCKVNGYTALSAPCELLLPSGHRGYHPLCDR